MQNGANSENPILPALNKSGEEVKAIGAAIKRGDPNTALGKSESLWALGEQIKTRLTET